MKLRSNLSLIFASAAPVTFFILLSGIHIPDVIPFASFLLCPLIAAFLGHSVLHKQKKLDLDTSGNSRLRAVLGISGAYTEIGFLVLVFITTPKCGGGPIAKNEASTVGSLRLVNHASDLYSERYPQEGFAPELRLLSKDSGKIDQTWSLDTALANGQRSGYRFTYVPSAKDAQGKIEHYTLMADPLIEEKTGIRHFYTDDTGAVRWEYYKPANNNSQLLQ
jgi:hypothetical protein